MDGDSYESAVRLIEEVERQSTKTDVNYIDVKNTFMTHESGKAQSYNVLVSLIEEIETGGGKGGKQQKEQPAQKVVQDAAHLITSGVTQIKFAQSPPQQPAPVSTVQPFRQEPEKNENVMKELGEITKRISNFGPKIQQMTRKKVDVKDLVLPNLSIADQISELERIIEGLKENVFDKEHIEIVKQEVYGLDQVLTKARKDKSRRIQLSSLEQSLWDLRDQRLRDAVALLQTYGAS